MSEESSEEPKLIIDEDWKTQVQREKEELKQKSAEEASREEVATDESSDENSSEADPQQSEPQHPDPQAQTEPSQAAPDAESLPPPPPASITLLATTLATQAMSALGQLPGDDGQTAPINLDYARHFIDLIGVLEEKTKGNLTEEESSYLSEILHQMRMAFVATSQQQT